MKFIHDPIPSISWKSFPYWPISLDDRGGDCQSSRRGSQHHSRFLGVADVACGAVGFRGRSPSLEDVLARLAALEARVAEVEADNERQHAENAVLWAECAESRRRLGQYSDNSSNLPRRARSTRRHRRTRVARPVASRAPVASQRLPCEQSPRPTHADVGKQSRRRPTGRPPSHTATGRFCMPSRPRHLRWEPGARMNRSSSQGPLTTRAVPVHTLPHCASRNLLPAPGKRQGRPGGRNHVGTTHWRAAK